MSECYAVMPFIDYVEACDAIRMKIDETDVIKSGELPQKIDKVYEAGLQAAKDRYWDELQDYGKRKSYFGFFAGASWTQERLNNLKYPIVFPKETSTLDRNCDSMFFRLNIRADGRIDLSHVCSMIDFSGCMTANQVFYNARAENITCDFSNCTNLKETFALGDGGSLENITLKVSEKCTKYTNTFYYCNPTNLIFTDDSVIAASVSFAQSSKLSDESVDSMVHALKDLTGATSQTLTVHANVYNRMVERGVDLLVTAKNWTLAKA